jgi:tripartite-type tricarboxylate transporter receptor subunit TctC
MESVLADSAGAAEPLIHMRSIAKLMALIVSFTVSCAHAAWPDKPVRVIVPYAAGAAGDLLIRRMQPDLQRRLGQPVIVDNKTGAGGNIGTLEAVRAKPDGYTLLLGATNNFVVNQYVYRNLGFDPLESLTPVSKLVDVPSVLFINSAIPAHTYAEFAHYAKAHPGKLNFGSPGLGTTPHLSAFALSRAIGANMVHVPFRGGAPGMQALLSNEVQMFLAGYGLAAAHLGEGKIRALAVASTQRLKAAPEIPTTKEAGVPDVILSNWWGLAAPQGTDPAIVQRLAHDFREVLQEPSMQEFLAREGFVAVGSTPSQFARELPMEAAQWQRIVNSAGARLE